MQTVAAVVVTYNRLNDLKLCIDSLNQQTRPLDAIIVINNGSTDGTSGWLAEQNGLTVITQSNLGGAGGFLAGGWITQALQTAGWSEAASFRFIFWLYAAAGLIKAALTSLLSSKCEVQAAPAERPSGQAQSEET